MNLMFWRRHNDDAPLSSEDRMLEQLSAYLDGELSDAEQATVEALIARDDVAAEVLQDLSLMRSAFGALGERRAPRSFAIPAGAVSAHRTAGSPMALFRRTEMFMRASAAVAALFFVVAVVNDPGNETPVAGVAFESVQTSMAAAEDATSGPALEPLSATEEGAGGGAGGGTTGLAAPAPETPAPDGDVPQSDGTANGTMGTLTAPSDGPAGGAADSGAADSGPADSGLADAAGETSRTTEELRPLPAGTEFLDDSSQDAGGMALGLGVLAALLTALSALTAWSQRSDGQTR